MIVFNTSNIPSDLPALKPCKLIVDAGYTIDNHKILLDYYCAKTSKDIECVDYDFTRQDFVGFFNLYDFLRNKNKKVRFELKEFGYSPYNLCLLIESLNMKKDQFSQLVGCSNSKMSANTAQRNSSYFKPLVGSQWVDIVEYYVKAVEYCHKKNAKTKPFDVSQLFFMVGDKNFPLLCPSK